MDMKKLAGDKAAEYVKDGIWTYDGFTVYTYKEGGSETVEAVQ